MKRFNPLFLVLASLLFVNCAFADVVKSTQPYECRGLKLKDAAGVPHNIDHQYILSGDCMVKVKPKGGIGGYQRVWLDIEADWDGKTNTAQESTEITAGGEGKIQMILKCQDDPWLNNSATCVLNEINNTTEFLNFSAKFNLRGINYPPIGRNVVTFDQAKKLSAQHKGSAPPPPPPPPPAPDKKRPKLKEAPPPKKEPVKLREAPKPKLQTPMLIPAVKVKDFHNPKYHGHAVDICAHWARNCGKPAADLWCKTQGFQSATQWKIVHDIGLKTPTIVIGDGRVCAHHFCDGFSYIRCTK